MQVTVRSMMGSPVETQGHVVGKVDDVYFDVRTGDVTHMSVALTGWYRGTIVLVPVEMCDVIYANRKVVFCNKSVEDIRQAPLLDDESVWNAESSRILSMYQDSAPMWDLSGRYYSMRSRSEAIEKKTGQPALWGSRDLRKATVSLGEGEKLGRIEDLELNSETWRITTVLVEHGHWYQYEHESIAVPVENILEVDKEGNTVTLVLRSREPSLAA